MNAQQTQEQLHLQAEALLNNNRLGEARALYVKLCDLNENDADAWLMLGAIDGEAGHIDRAIRHAERAIAIDPGYVEARLALARLLVHCGNISEALTTLNEAVEIDSEYTEAWILLASIHGQLHNYTEAATCSLRALDQDNSATDAHISLGNALYAQGKFQEALTHYQTAAQQHPNTLLAWSRLGASHLALNQFDAAEACLLKALALAPQHMDTQMELARIYIASSRHDDAINLLRGAIQSHPSNEALWQALVIASVNKGDIDAWLQFCQHITSVNPDSGPAWLGLGYAFEHSADWENARASYQKATDLSPALHDAWCRKGIVCAALERYDEALEYFSVALLRGSDAAITHCGYGSMLRRKGRFTESEEHCRIATERAPKWPLGFYELGNVLIEQGRLEEAAQTYLQALALEPANKDCVAGLAQAYERMGNSDDAYRAIEPFLARNDTNSGIVCTYARLSGSLGAQKDALSRIDSALKNEELGTQQRIDLHFRAADIYHGMREYDLAMEHYKQANALKPVAYDHPHHAEFISDIINGFSRQMFDAMPQASISTDSPIFIVGMPRSGTSLVEQILACHEKVHGAGELMEIGNACSLLGFRDNRHASIADLLRTLTQDALNEISREYLEKLNIAPTGKERVTDKMPHNFLWLGIIQLLLPNARIIHVRRNAMDTCLSCYFTDFNGVHEYAYDLENLGNYYCEYLRLMAHWRRVLSVAFLEINYEDLVADPEDISRIMIDFCGLEWDANVLEYHKSKRFVNTTSYKQVRSPVYTTSIGKWNFYTKHLGPLLRSLSMHADCNELTQR